MQFMQQKTQQLNKKNCLPKKLMIGPMVDNLSKIASSWKNIENRPFAMIEWNSLGSQPWQRLDSCCREEFGYLTHAIGLRAKLGQVKNSKGINVMWQVGWGQKLGQIETEKDTPKFGSNRDWKKSFFLRLTWSRFSTLLAQTYSTPTSAQWLAETMMTQSSMSIAQTLTRYVLTCTFF